MIKITDGSKSYRNKVLFKDLNMEITSGQIYGFIGQNGTGKTTVFKALAGLCSLSSGSITKDSTLEIEFLDDSYSLFNDTVAYNMEFYTLKYPKFNKTEFMEKLVMYSINPEEHTESLSKGQKALVRLALAQASTANLILIDELLDGLDLNNRLNVIENIITDPLEERSYFIIDHNIEDLLKLTENFFFFDNKTIRYLEDINTIYETYPTLRQWYQEELR